MGLEMGEKVLEMGWRAAVLGGGGAYSNTFESPTLTPSSFPYGNDVITP